MKRKWKAPTGESVKDQKSPHVDDFSAQNNNPNTVAKEGGSGFGDSFNPRGRTAAVETYEDPNFTRERGLFNSELNDEERKAVNDQAKMDSLSPDHGNKSSETSGAANPRKPAFGNKKGKNVFDPFGKKKSNASNSGPAPPARPADPPRDNFTLGGGTNTGSGTGLGNLNSFMGNNNEVKTVDSKKGSFGLSS